MKGTQISLATILLLTAALPIWLFLAFTIPLSTGWGDTPFRFVAAPFVLAGITAAVHRLVRHHQNAWAFSVLLAGVIACGFVAVVSWLTR